MKVKLKDHPKIRDQWDPSQVSRFFETGDSIQPNQDQVLNVRIGGATLIQVREGSQEGGISLKVSGLEGVDSIYLCSGPPSDFDFLRELEAFIKKDFLGKPVSELLETDVDF